MNYIYDIVLNFQKNYYEFYEWKRKDNIKNIIKIPVYRISDKNIKYFKYNQIKISNTSLQKIKNDNKKYKKAICLISNTKTTIGLLFDNEGNLIKRSSLIYEEEDEVNDFCKNIELTNIEIIKNIPKKTNSKSRLETEKKEAIIHFLNKTNDKIILKYIYYEYFKKENNNPIQIKKILKEELEKKWTIKQNNIYTLIKIFQQKNLPTK